MAISFQKITYIYDAGMPYAHAAINDIDLELEEGDYWRNRFGEVNSCSASECTSIAKQRQTGNS